jgi:hypothetical protein
VSKVKKEKPVEVLNYEELITTIDEQIALELKQEEPNYKRIGEWIANKELLEIEWLEHMKKVS